ncbi:MAG TPA: signal peptidase II [Rhizomicrobium sp.]
MSPRDWGLAAAAGALALDQASKLTLLYGYHFKALGEAAAPGIYTVTVLPFFNIVMTWNPGVSYGLFPAHSRLGSGALVLLSLVAVVGLGWWLWNATRRALAVGLGLVIGGAIGNNLIDRLIYGKVADFFHFHAFGYGWYVFNVADAAITFGVIALLYDALLRPEAHPGREPAKRN